MRLLNPPVRGKHTHIIDELSFERTGYIEFVHKAITTDQIQQRVVKRLVEMQLSNGFRIFSIDEKIDNSVSRRLDEIQLQSGMRLYQIIHDLFYEFVAYGNQFAVLVRNQALTSGKKYKFQGNTLDPIAAIFKQPTRFVSIRRKANGDPIEYRIALNELLPSDQDRELIARRAQSASNNYQQRFQQNDVVHFALNPDPDLGGFGRPIILEQLDDLLVLRSMETQLDDMIRRAKFYQKYYIVGSENMPPNPNSVQAVKEKIEQNDPDEIMIVPQPDKVGIQFEDIITPVINSIKEFKNRTYSGLGQSGVQMGEGGSANRQTAERVLEGFYQMQRNLQKMFQQIFESQILQQIVLDLGYDPQQIGNQFPKLVFEDPDIERTMQKNQHYALLFTQNVITEDEMRSYIGLGPLSEDQRSKLYANLYGQTKVNISANQNIVQPQNQHKGGDQNG